MYIYKKTEPGLWTVGYFKPKGNFEPESDHGSADEAAYRVSLLNGGPDAVDLFSIKITLIEISESLQNCEAALLKLLGQQKGSDEIEKKPEKDKD